MGSKTFGRRLRLFLCLSRRTCLSYLGRWRYRFCRGLGRSSGRLSWEARASRQLQPGPLPRQSSWYLLFAARSFLRPAFSPPPRVSALPFAGATTAGVLLLTGTVVVAAWGFAPGAVPPLLVRSQTSPQPAYCSLPLVLALEADCVPGAGCFFRSRLRGGPRFTGGLRSRRRSWRGLAIGAGILRRGHRRHGYCERKNFYQLHLNSLLCTLHTRFFTYFAGAAGTAGCPGLAGAGGRLFHMAHG